MALLHTEFYTTRRPVFTRQDKDELNRLTNILIAYDIALERLQSDLDLATALHDGMIHCPNDKGLRFVFKDSIEELGYVYSVEGVFQSMWEGIKKVFNTIIEKIKQFFLWVARLFGFCKSEADKSNQIIKELKQSLDAYGKAKPETQNTILEKITQYRSGGSSKMEEGSGESLFDADVWSLVDNKKSNKAKNNPVRQEKNAEKQEEQRQAQQQQNNSNSNNQQSNQQPISTPNAESAAGPASTEYLSDLVTVANTVGSLKDKAAAVEPALGKFVQGLQQITSLSNDTMGNIQSGATEGGTDLKKVADEYMQVRAQFNQKQAPTDSKSFVEAGNYDTLNTNIGNYEQAAQKLSEGTKLLASQLERISKLTPAAGQEALFYSKEDGETQQPPPNPPNTNNAETNQQANPNQPNNQEDKVNSQTSKQILKALGKTAKDVQGVMKDIVRIENDCANTRSNFNKMMGSVVKIINEGLKSESNAAS